MDSDDFVIDLQNYSSNEVAVSSSRFFKTGPGEYGEGDVFIGVRMPKLRVICKKFANLRISELERLVDSPVHEHRMAALIITTNKFKIAGEAEQKQLYDFYMDGLKRGRVNSWDLIDVTCPHVVGGYLQDKPRNILYELARSKSLWDRRASILATMAFIKNGEANDTLQIAKILQFDEEDLIHKAVGWMLREVGRRVNQKVLCDFLDQHAHEMPRTMLRYSIEHLNQTQKQKYMSAKSIQN